MSKGNSGRIVIVVDTELKKQLHALIAFEGRSLKEWFIEKATEYISNKADQFNGTLSSIKSKPNDKQERTL